MEEGEAKDAAAEAEIEAPAPAAAQAAAEQPEEPAPVLRETHAEEFASQPVAQPRPRPQTAVRRAPATRPQPPARLLVIDFQKLILLSQALHYLATNRLRGLGRLTAQTGLALAQAVKLATVMLAVLALLLFGFGATRVLARSRPATVSLLTPSPGYQTQPQPSAGSRAAAAVSTFYRRVGRGDYRAAYGDLTHQWQTELAFGRFVKGFNGVSAIGCRVSSRQLLEPGLVRVNVVLDVLENDVPKTYNGFYLVVRTSRGWRLDRGHLTNEPFAG